MSPGLTSIYRPGSIAVRQGQAWCESEHWTSRLERPAWLPPGAPVALHVPDSVFTVAAVSWFWQNGCRAALIPAERDPATAQCVAAGLGCRALLSVESRGWQWTHLAPSPIEPPHWGSGAAGGLLLLTSGTTGEPKKILHSWDSLAASLARPSGGGNRRGVWFTLYPLTRYAGLTVLLQALASEAVLCLPTAHDASTLARELVQHRPTMLSGTPTLWRTLLIYLPDDAQWRAGVEQITLGGEIVDQPVLDRLHLYFPNARLTHIYASTEAGICLSVSDGRAGFPAAWLDQEHRGVSLRVEAGQLLILRRGARSEIMTEGWWPTGDRVNVQDGRVTFLGRDSEIMNVGGAKVSPAEVEACIGGVPGIAAVRVFGIPSSFAGTLVAAEIVPGPGVTEEELRGLVSRHCRTHLASYAVPRSLRFVSSLVVSTSGKLDRSSSI